MASTSVQFLGPVRTSSDLVNKEIAAPADGAISANELATWFDPTNGAARVMFKAKQADGTVRTGSIPLTGSAFVTSTKFGTD